MHNWRLLCCLVAGVFLLLAGGGIYLVVRVLPDRITPENYERIEVGMDTREVAALLGRRPDRQFAPTTGDGAVLGPPIWHESWVGEQGVIVIHLDPHGKVTKKQYYKVRGGLGR
jgi:hypothetical protein